MSGCGGGGGGSATTSGSGTTIVAATPTPTPTPAVTVTPTPTPAAAVVAIPTPTPAAVVVDSPAVTAAPARYTPIAAAKASVGLTLPVGKCLNYAGQLEVKSDPAWMRPVTDSDFADMRAQGFATLRVMVNFERYTAKAAPYAIDTAFLARVRHVVDTATAAGLNVIIENHEISDLRADLAGQKPRFAAIWRQVAAEFRNAPGSVWFELVNEPHDEITNADLPGLYGAAITEIRATNSTRPIILDGASWADLNWLSVLSLTADPYLVPTFHYYAPMSFTHQGAPFMTPVLPTGVTWGSDAQYAQLDADVARVKAYIASTGRVPFLGEFGVYEGVATEQRAKYMGDVSRAFASIGVSSCAYGYVNAFPIRTASGGWIRPIVDALGAPL